MDSLEYSNDALEVIPNFYNCDYTVYVEGGDDVIFWENIFRISNKNVHVEEVGGIEELKKYISKIIEDDVAIYVARDNDYCDFVEDKINHERIFTTFGHSIENTLYNRNAIKSIIKKFSRISGDVLPEEIDVDISTIINNFEESVKPILIYEIANDVFQKGVSVLGTNSCKFLKNNSSTEICLNKISNSINNISNQFVEQEITNISTKLETIEKPLWSIIRGHFLTNFVINLIKKMVIKISNKKINLPVDLLYPLLIDTLNLTQSEDIYHYNY